jgi:hypothetical protein
MAATVGFERDQFRRRRSQFDPLPPTEVLETGHRNRPKPPVK